MHVGDGRNNDDWSAFPHVRDTLVQWGLVDPGISQKELEPQTGLKVAKIEAQGGNPVDLPWWGRTTPSSLKMGKAHCASR